MTEAQLKQATGFLAGKEGSGKALRQSASEKERQAAGVDLLRRLGYIVLELGQYKAKAVCGRCSRAKGQRVYAVCPSCANEVYGSGGYGNAPGTPDTLITHPRWPANCWHAQEWKMPTTERRQAQKDLVASGASVFILDAHEAVKDLIDFEERLGLSPNSRLLAYLRDNK